MPETDPNQVRLTGENSFIRLLDQEGGSQLTRVSHWRILYSPEGGGHVLFIQSDITDGAVQVYADNAALARWLQGEIESLLYPPFADQNLPIVPAAFSRSSDTRTAWTERVEAPNTHIALTWSDLAEPFMLTLAAGSVPGRPHGVGMVEIESHTHACEVRVRHLGQRHRHGAGVLPVGAGDEP